MGNTAYTRRPMVSRRRRKARGFSLIELLINMAIISALVGIVVPIYQDYVLETQTAKAEQDLDVVVSAINRSDALETKVIGTSLDPLLGRYLTFLPLDPWGNDYAFDGFICVVGTFGGDGTPFAAEPDDVFRQYNKFLTPIRVKLRGSFGPPRAGHILKILTSKPFMLIPGFEAMVSEEIELVKANGDRYPLHELGYRYCPAETNGFQCRLALQCSFPNLNVGKLTLTPEDTINFGPMMFSVTDFASPDGAYAGVADDFRYGPVPYTGPSGGIPIERD